ncbi:MAG TPA: FGGY family carbohydrate kinase [Planctomycetota bacterium]|nr:FGGY family carbohydrate kinase [Planctomycetota bacterium]HRR79333.1 FGGY family carbohydrate kinase [Planctomycetota bacterium]
MAQLLAGLDIGTSGVKVGVADASGHLLGLGRAAHANDSPRPGWVQCDPERWWQGVIASLHQACAEAKASPADIAAVGVSVLFPCVAPLDADGRALHPALLYCDRRSCAQAEAIAALVPRQEYEATIGNVLTPGTCAATSLLWLCEEAPDAWHRAHSLGFANTAITARLTGEFCTDPTQVALSGLVDIRDPWRWNEALCERLAIAADRLPRVAGADEVIGTVTRTAARETGLNPGTPVVCGCGDVPASALGAGAAEPGTVIYVAGSTDCVAVPTCAPTPDRRWVNSAYIPRGLWLPIGTTTSSGVSVEWFCRELLGQPGAEGLRSLTELAQQAPPGAGGLLYLPYLQGERTPIWDPKARGSFFGLSTATTRADLARSVLEGTAFALRQVVACLETVLGSPLAEIRSVGGGTRNPLWNQIKADVLGKRLAVLEFQETSALGAALLAAVGAGLCESFAAAARAARAANRVRLIEPHASRTASYDYLFRLFAGLYPATRPLARRLSSWGAPRDSNPP